MDLLDSSIKAIEVIVNIIKITPLDGGSDCIMDVVCSLDMQSRCAIRFSTIVCTLNIIELK